MQAAPIHVAAALAAVLLTLAVSPTALAQAPSVVVEDGVTQPVFDYGSAIRERVWIQSDFDSDLDGVDRPDGGSVVCSNGVLHDAALRALTRRG